jgi:uncharacterized protein
VRLAGGRALWGNPPEVLRRVRDPFVLADVLRGRGLEPPLVHRVDAASPDGPWLIKPRASGGGRRIVRWDRRPIDRDGGQWYLQQEIAGTPGSIVFVAAHGRAVPLALTVQIVGDAAFGASGFTYCGNMLDVHASPALVASALQLAQIVAEEFELVGVNGVDFIARDDSACPLEVNPRWCASMELVEMACHVSVFAAHAAACTTGALPPVPPPPRRTHGKAIVYSPGEATIRNTDEWSARGWIRDIPHSGERIAAGAPVCSVFADGRDVIECRARLAERAARIHHTLGYDASCRT